MLSDSSPKEKEVDVTAFRVLLADKEKASEINKGKDLQFIVQLLY